MKELTDDQKMKLYSKPELTQEEQINNEITGYNRLISEAQQFVSEIETIPQTKFLSDQFITFHEKRITDKGIIKKFYEILISDWHYKIDSAKKELSILKGGNPFITNDTVEEATKKIEDQINQEPTKPKKKRFNFFELVDNILSRVPKVVETIDTIKSKK